MVFKYTFKYSLHKFTKTYYIKKNYSKTSLQRTRIRRTLGYNVLESAVPTISHVSLTGYNVLG